MSEPWGFTPDWRIDLAGLGLAGLLGAGSYLLVVAPASAADERARSQRAALARMSEQIDDQEAQTRAAQARLERARALLAGNTVKLAAATELNERIGALAGLADAHGLRLDRLDPGARAATSRFVRVPIRLEGRAEYAAFAGFLAALHERFPDTAVATLTLSARRGEGPGAGGGGGGSGGGGGGRVEGASGNDGSPGAVPAGFVVELIWFAAPEGRAGPGRSAAATAP